MEEIKSTIFNKNEQSNGIAPAEVITYFKDISNEYVQQQSLNKYYIEVTFDNKDYVKKYGAKWDVKNKKWFVDSENCNMYKLYKRLDLNVQYDDKDFVKENGGKWDKENKTWYTYQSNDILGKYAK